MIATEYGSNAYLFSKPIFEVTGGTSSIPLAQNGDLLYSTYCQGCHGAAPGARPDRTLAQIQNAIATVPTMQTTALQGLSTAELTLIEARLSSNYVAPLDGLALFQVNCSGCHGAAPGSSVNGTLAGKTVAQIDAAIADTTKSMNTAGLETLTVAEKTAISDAINTAVQATGYNIQIDNIRVGVNGTTPPVGQSLKNLSVLLTINNQALKSIDNTGTDGLGVVIPQSGGIATDSFFLEFERINAKSNVIVEANPAAPPADMTTVIRPENGIRNFDQVNDTMSALTGVPKSDTYNSYVDLKSQLPSSNSIMTFVASNQVVVMKHALDYCTRMVGNGNYFGTANPGTAQIQDIVVDKILGTGFVSQPNRDAVRGDIYTLLTSIGCSGDGTVVTSCNDNNKAQVTACVAGLSSAPVVLY